MTQRSGRRRLPEVGAIAAGLALLALMAAPLAAGVGLRGRHAPTASAPLAHGTVVLLRDTPHFWVADEGGVLHWAGGTRALVGRFVRWDAVREVTAAELERLPRGEPWLLTPVAFIRDQARPGGATRAVSADLAQQAQAASDRVYVVVWHVGVTWPALVRAPSTEALRPFGITAEHVTRLGTDVQTWERLHDMPVEALSIDLMPIAATSRPGAAAPGWWTEGRWSGTGVQVSPADTYLVSVTLHRPRVDAQLGVVVGEVAYPSFPCSGFVGLLGVTTLEGEEEALLAEQLTAGLENCTDQGRVSLIRRAERRLFYTWALPDRAMAVTGFLLKEDSPTAGATTVATAGATAGATPTRR